MALIKCPKCGAEADADASFCLNCGATLRSLRIVDMRPMLDVGPRNRQSRSASGKPETYTAKTSYRSGILEAKSALERNMGILRSPVVVLPEEDQRDAKRWNRTVLATIAVSLLLVIVLVILAILVATYL